MCTELILAFIYFITIFFVNYFLFKLLKNNYKNILYFLKIEKIFRDFNVEQKNNVFYYLIRLKKKLGSIYLIEFLNKQINTNDFLIIGGTYNFLINEIELNTETTDLTRKQEQRKTFFANKVYLNLLKDQYLGQD
jgi:hypothetical protein